MVEENASPKKDEPAEDERSALPMTAGIIGLLAVAALIVFWPSGGGDDSGAERPSQRPSARDGKGPAGGRGGVQARGYDEAKQAPGKGRMNPALKLPSTGMAPGPAPSNEPPEFDTPMEELAWYEKRLVAAQSNLKMRERALARLDRARTQAENAPDPSQALAQFEESKRRVEENHRLAKQQLAEVEAKLAELKTKAGQ